MSNQSKSTLRRLLRRNISAAQLAGYALANFTGLLIVLCAMQFYRDVNTALNSASDRYINRDFLVISPQVSTVGTLTGGAATFTPQAVEELRAQPWVRKVGEFTNADFKVSASVDLGNQGMQTFLFFESIPDEFFDVRPSGWDFDPEKGEIPIIVSKDYLALYNFGFASTRGLPQLSENVINKVPLAITMAGNGRIETMRGRIVGFSARFNTIAVPEKFMLWANARFGSADTPEQPSRLIVEADNPGAPQVGEFLRAHGYEVAGDKSDSSRASYFLSVVTGIVIAVGAVISVLAFFILVLSMSLLLQKNRRKLSDLMLLGYSPAQAARGYLPILISINAITLAALLAAVTGAALWWQTRLESASVGASILWPTLATGFAAILLITLLSYLNVLRTLRRYFRP